MRMSGWTLHAAHEQKWCQLTAVTAALPVTACTKGRGAHTLDSMSPVLQATREQTFSVTIPNVVAGQRTFVCRVQEDFAGQVSSWASRSLLPVCVTVRNTWTTYLSFWSASMLQGHPASHLCSQLHGRVE